MTVGIEAFVAIAAMMIAMLVSMGIAAGIVAAFTASRVCRRDWAAPKAIDNTPNRA